MGSLLFYLYSAFHNTHNFKATLQKSIIQFRVFCYQRCFQTKIDTIYTTISRLFLSSPTPSFVPPPFTSQSLAAVQTIDIMSMVQTAYFPTI